MTITIRPVEDPEGSAHFQELTRRVWGSEEIDVVPTHVTMTVLKNGGMLLAAYAPDGPAATGGMVGAAFWWLGVGVDAATPSASPRLKACSHMLGVLPEWQGRHVGLRLKLAQRQAVLEQELTDWITWTYDPLYRANGVFNIHRLGATCKTYKRNIYGELRDALNAGVPSDRFQVDWHLNSPHVLVDIDQARQERDWNMTAIQMLPVQERRDKLLQPVDAIPDLDGRPLAVPLPGDIGVIRRSDRDLSLAWRFYLREVIEAAFAGGYTVVDCVHLDEHGWRYILVREIMKGE
jgi:predicted GNAT superfamily acetyltransferase